MTEIPWLDTVQFGADGLVPVVAQDARSGQVLMHAWANREALLATRATGQAHYYSRSRAELWHKGSTSGHHQVLCSIHLDCDQDTILYRVIPQGPSCHLGRTSCFDATVESSEVPPATGHSLDRLDHRLAERATTRPEGSYTVRLLEAGPRAIAQKVGEEGVEVALAAVAEDPDRLVSESVDLLYHLLVLLRSREVPLTTVFTELDRRLD